MNRCKECVRLHSENTKLRADLEAAEWDVTVEVHNLRVERDTLERVLRWKTGVTITDWYKFVDENN
jgi:hypothetical protein